MDNGWKKKIYSLYEQLTIELMWAWLKSHLRKAKARTPKKLEESIRCILNSLKSEFIANWFRHCGYSL